MRVIVSHFGLSHGLDLWRLLISGGAGVMDGWLCAGAVLGRRHFSRACVSKMSGALCVGQTTHPKCLRATEIDHSGPHHRSMAPLALLGEACHLRCLDADALVSIPVHETPYTLYAP
jgi:hypothetical protein